MTAPIMLQKTCSCPEEPGDSAGLRKHYFKIRCEGKREKVFSSSLFHDREGAEPSRNLIEEETTNEQMAKAQRLGGDGSSRLVKDE